MELLILSLFLVLAVSIILAIRKKKSARKPAADPQLYHQLLEAHVPFYRRLDKTARQQFLTRVSRFLDTVRITPVGNVDVTPLDRLYVAASAIIPIAAFPDWSYNNLNEVLIYPDHFSRDFDERTQRRDVLGMVGDGAMHRMMILSLPALRAGFEDTTGGNTGIHEFVHLLDKADGATDGVPEYMLPAALVQPWIRYMREEIAAIRSRHSDINPYAGTNDAEFFAVVSEYFFKKPGLLREHHPQLYAMLEDIYKTAPRSGGMQPML